MFKLSQVEVQTKISEQYYYSICCTISKILTPQKKIAVLPKIEKKNLVLDENSGGYIAAGIQ